MKRDVPVDTQTIVNRRHAHRPDTPLEALMSCAPGEEPDLSKMELLALKEVLADAIDRLDLRHKWVFEQHVIARIPVRTLGVMMGLGKSYVWLLVQEAKQMLQDDLAQQPLIQDYFNRHQQEDVDAMPGPLDRSVTVEGTVTS